MINMIVGAVIGAVISAAWTSYIHWLTKPKLRIDNTFYPQEITYDDEKWSFLNVQVSNPEPHSFLRVILLGGYLPRTPAYSCKIKYKFYSDKELQKIENKRDKDTYKEEFLGRWGSAPMPGSSDIAGQFQFPTIYCGGFEQFHVAQIELGQEIFSPCTNDNLFDDTVYQLDVNKTYLLEVIAECTGAITKKTFDLMFKKDGTGNFRFCSKESS